jgi:hypothetical protein
MQATNSKDPATRKLRFLVYKYLREVNYLTDLPYAKAGNENVGKIACRDDRSFMTEAAWIQELHEKKGHKLAVMPLPMFGGAMRFSPYCPEMPDELVGFKSAPNVFHTEVLVEAIRFGIKFRNNRLIKAGGHGLFCGWASALGLGMFQHTRLTIDGRDIIEARSQREHWTADGNFEVFAAHHMDCRYDEAPQARTYGLDHDHPLLKKYPMELTMETLDDRRFLEIEAPHLLKEAGIE